MNWSIGGKVLDIYDDPNLALLASSPHFQKVGSLELGDPARLKDLEDRQFGVVFITKKGEFIRKYPLNDYTNAVLSNVYFEMTHEKLPPEAKVAAATQIKEASEVFGFKPVETVTKYAADESVAGRNYVRLDKVAVRHASGVDAVGLLRESYVQNSDLYTREDKIALARDMAKVASSYDFEVPADLKPFAIQNPELDKEAFFSQCAQRKQLVAGNFEARSCLDDFMAKAAQFEPLETVKLLETFDRQFGLDQYWGRNLEPNLVLREKVAYHNLPIRGGNSVSDLTDDELKSWAGSNGDLLRKMFGKELAEKFQKNPRSTLWALPEASRTFLGARIEHARDNTPVEAK